MGREMMMKLNSRRGGVEESRHVVTPTCSINRHSTVGVMGVGWGFALAAIVLVPILILFLCIPASASAHTSANTGRIFGQLLNGTKHKAPVAGQRVTLQMAQGDTARDLTTITTDAHGTFSFDGLNTDKTINYAVYTAYQGAQYYTDLISLPSKPV